MAAEEEYRTRGGRADDFIKPYIGLKAVDAVKKMLPSENERQMWENELQNKIRKAAEDIYYALHKAAGRGYRGIEIKVNSMGDIEARDEEIGEIFSLTFDGKEFVK